MSAAVDGVDGGSVDAAAAAGCGFDGGCDDDGNGFDGGLLLPVAEAAAAGGADADSPPAVFAAGAADGVDVVWRMAKGQTKKAN